MKNHDFKVDGKVEIDGALNWPDNLNITLSRGRALQLIETLATSLRFNTNPEIMVNLVGKLDIESTPF